MMQSGNEVGRDYQYPDEDLCMHESGCEQPGTILVERPDHWHDDVYCPAHYAMCK